MCFFPSLLVVFVNLPKLTVDRSQKHTTSQRSLDVEACCLGGSCVPNQYHMSLSWWHDVVRNIGWKKKHGMPMPSRELHWLQGNEHVQISLPHLQRTNSWHFCSTPAKMRQIAAQTRGRLCAKIKYRNAAILASQWGPGFPSFNSSIYSHVWSWWPTRFDLPLYTAHQDTGMVFCFMLFFFPLLGTRSLPQFDEPFGAWIRVLTYPLVN